MATRSQLGEKLSGKCFVVLKLFFVNIYKVFAYLP
jgi:hypothetical protein